MKGGKTMNFVLVGDALINRDDIVAARLKLGDFGYEVVVTLRASAQQTLYPEVNVKGVTGDTEETLREKIYAETHRGCHRILQLLATPK